MKQLALLPLALVFATNAAIAANSVDLRVTGTITPSACDISLVGGSDFNLGAISANGLAATTSTTLPAVGGKTLNIICSGATQVAFKAIDNRASSRPSEITSSTAFGLGMDGSNNPIGYYNIGLVQSTMLINGASGKYKASDDAGANWFTFSAPIISLLATDRSPRIGTIDLETANNAAQPTPITSASTEIQVTSFIQPENVLDTSAEITLDGSATIELVYL
ncbi:DUF1120 domain-containing protein [Pseudomonas resinovorans]|uniref:DUF1120 domain-containing protein n=1 Tax=Metapseudomonas resinovorans TaxID=53412 RepID=A0ABT4YCV0_METRE|nr:DUF1120 domain-containing protein [Pseudomonas resinovorans]MDA8486727.1 DUF1120 domain-containing protein [Pseudomonas resinovorans]